MHKILVFGGSGFIGSHVIDELITHGYEPIVFDHHGRTMHRDVELFLGDVRDKTAVMEAVAHSDGWINLAACLGTQETIKNPYPALETNVMGGINVLEAATHYDVPGVYIAVGNYWHNNPYSITKNMIERFCEMYRTDRGTKVNVVRAVNAYGPRQLAFEPFAHSKVRKITPSLVCRALSGMPMELYGGGTQISDMVYVGDVAKALVNALEYANKGKNVPTVEVGSVEHTTILEVADVVNKIVSEHGYQKVDIKKLPMRPGEAVGKPVTADVKTLWNINMSPSDLTSLYEGMIKTIEWFIANEGKSWTRPN